MTLSEQVSQNLKRARVRRKLSQSALAEKAGLAVSYVSMLERGKRSPPLDTLAALAGALGVAPAKLLGGSTP